jgi:serine protease Do
MSRIALLCAASLLALGLTGTAQAQSHSTDDDAFSVVEVVEKTQPSIAMIRVPRSKGDDLVGTGVIVDERGYIVTNRHVVGANRTVEVRLHDGTRLLGEVVMNEPRWDLAVVRVQPDRKLVALPLAPTDDLMVGEDVVAIGHPFGFANTVSTGIVSAIHREVTLTPQATVHGLIQTDASINPGNSGGPLLNVNGELIGINVAIHTKAQGIAFAINASMVKAVLSQHFSALRVAGVDHGLQTEEKTLAQTGDRQRVVVKTDRANLHAGDQIVTVAGRQITNTFDVERALWETKPGQEVALKVVRQGKEMEISLTLFSGNGAGTASIDRTLEPRLAMPAQQSVRTASDR